MIPHKKLKKRGFMKLFFTLDLVLFSSFVAAQSAKPSLKKFIDQSANHK
jgi:hypothetical protein